MRARGLAVLAVLLLATASGLAQTFPDRCANQAPLPFAAIELKHPVDQTCALKGKTTSPPRSQLQNSVKNNFCGLPANQPPQTFTPQMLIDLQRNNHIPSGQGKEPTDRAQLRSLGEGKVIRLKAYLIEAHHADLGNGESVNCDRPKEEDNDVHMALGAQPSTQECDSISAEISPHYRPASWNEIGHFEKWNPATKRYDPNPTIASRLQAHPYRITGQLFFDASHAPCPCGTACNPIRASVWEIHPIYNIEVCKAGTSCDENTDADWIAFDTWWKSLAPPRVPTKPRTHPPHEPKPPTKASRQDHDNDATVKLRRPREISTSYQRS